MKSPSIRRFAAASAILSAFVLETGSNGRPLHARDGQGGVVSTITFRALAGDGQPITDLKAADVSLRIDNAPREVRSLELVTLNPPEGGVAAAAAAPIPLPFATNAASGGNRRSLMLLVDEESIAPGKEQAVREAITFVMTGLRPGDRVALMSMRQGGPRSALTADHAAVKNLLGSLGGYGSTRENAGDLRCRTVRLLQNLQSVFAAQTDGAAGTVVFFSTSVAALQPGQTARIGTATGSDLCELRTENFNQFAGVVQASRANFYVMEIMDGSGAPAMAEAAGGLENLAGVTNGEMVRLGTNVEGQMLRVLRETAVYYLVSFEDGERGSPNRRLDLTVARPGARIRAPRELAPAGGAKKAAAKATPRDMIRTAEAFNDLPLRAVAFSSRNPGDDKIRVLALFEPADRATKLNAAMIGLFDKAGKLQAQWTAQANDLAAPTVLAALVVPPGTYRMRVAATDGSGKAGAVDSELSAAIIAAGPIHLGDLVLGKITQTGAVPVMQFSSEQEGIAMIELYGRPAGPLTAYVEVTTGGQGEPLHASPLQPAATSEQDKFILSAKIPLTSLKPGDYLVRAVIGVQGQEGRVTRTLRKVGG